MRRQSVNTALVFALLLALCAGWASHAVAWLHAPAPLAADHHRHAHDHAHAHTDSAAAQTVCGACSAPGHAHWPGDHLHETAHPVTLPRLPAPTVRLALPALPRRALPEGPVSRIERPPRPIAPH